MNRRKIAFITIFVADVVYALWGAAAAASPVGLLGPGGKAILPAGFEGYTSESWAALVTASPASVGYMTLLFRTYGIHCAVFGFMGAAIAATAFRRGEAWAWWTLLVANTAAFLSAITYDRMANAIGPFELTEYLGLALVWAALAITHPFGEVQQVVPAASVR